MCECEVSSVSSLYSTVSAMGLHFEGMSKLQNAQQFRGFRKNGAYSPRCNETTGMSNSRTMPADFF